MSEDIYIENRRELIQTISNGGFSEDFVEKELRAAFRAGGDEHNAILNEAVEWIEGEGGDSFCGNETCRKCANRAKIINRLRATANRITP